MKKTSITSFYILLFFFTSTCPFPCPPECICESGDMNNDDFLRISYLIDCTNASLNNQQLIYEAEEWSRNQDILFDDDYFIANYAVTVDLSNSMSLKRFTNQTIQFTNFSYIIRSLSLTNQRKDFILDSNSFYSPLYENLKILNLSSCCKRIPEACQQIFRRLENLRVLDLSGSDMYKYCLNTAGILHFTIRFMKNILFRGPPLREPWLSRCR